MLRSQKMWFVSPMVWTTLYYILFGLMRLLVGLILNLWMGQLEQKIGELPFLLIGISRNLTNQLLTRRVYRSSLYLVILLIFWVIFWVYEATLVLFPKRNEKDWVTVYTDPVPCNYVHPLKWIEKWSPTFPGLIQHTQTVLRIAWPQ